MIVKPENDVYSEKGYRIRCMESLIMQIREGHAKLNRVREMGEKVPRVEADMEDFVRVLSWLKQDLSLFKSLRKRGIEGIAWGKLEHIERDVKARELDLRLILLSIRKKREFTHLR